METIKDLNFLNTLLPLAGIIFIIGAGVVLLNQHFQKNLTAQKLKQEELKSQHQLMLLQSSIRAQEEERKRMAQDLHDELGAVLSIMRMHLVMLEQQSTSNGESLTAGLQNARQLSETALASIRSISHQLMPPQLEAFGLVQTLESVIAQISRTGTIAIELTTTASLADLSWTVNLGLYRILMELINNTIRHAGAGAIKIMITRDDRFITCHYSDDGKGLVSKDMHSGLGYKSMEGRVSSLNGTFEFGTAETGGFYAVVRVPALMPAAS